MANDKEKPVRRYVLSEKGNTLVLFVIALPILLGAAGLVLDWGRGVSVKTRLQKAADAGALAGASFLQDTDVAEIQASGFVAANFEDPDEATYSFSSDDFTIELTEQVPAFFMQLFGYEDIEVVVRSTAAAPRPVGGLNGCGFPIAVINPDLNDDPCDDLNEWNYGQVFIIGYGEANVMVEDWANGCDPPPSSPGQGNGNNSQGWRGALGLRDDGTIGNCGASDLRNNMEFGWPGILLLGDEVPMKKGNMAGPMRDGREALLGDDPMDWDDFDPEIHGDSSRVVLVPVIHLIHETRRDTYTVQDWLNDADWDNQVVVVDGFAPFFILAEGEYEQYLDVQGNAHDWILGYYIPGVETSHFYEPDEDNPEYGVYSPPRLTD